MPLRQPDNSPDPSEFICPEHGAGVDHIEATGTYYCNEFVGNEFCNKMVRRVPARSVQRLIDAAIADDPAFYERPFFYAGRTRRK